MQPNNVKKECPYCKGEMKLVSYGWLELEEQEAAEFECLHCNHTEYELV